MSRSFFQVCTGLFMVFFWMACTPEESPTVYNPTPYNLQVGNLNYPTIATDNPLTTQGVLLGRMLFHDKKLSVDGTISCASCHLQEHAFSDTAVFSRGINSLTGHRHSMAIFNMAWNDNQFFWDGRADLLRNQALLPIQDPLEMNETLDNLIAKLESHEDYRDYFFRAFGSYDITEESIALALEQFMLSIVSVNSKYDRHERGEAVFTASEMRGKELFFNEYNPAFPDISGADCAHCHSGKNFENDDYMNNGLDSVFTDEGRFMATANNADKGKFKVPSLRNIEVTAPYMHDGRFQTLEEVVRHYNTDMVYSSTIDPALLYPLYNGGLQLTDQDVQDLIAFLKTLTDDDLLSNAAYSNPF